MSRRSSVQACPAIWLEDRAGALPTGSRDPGTNFVVAALIGPAVVERHPRMLEAETTASQFMNLGASMSRSPRVGDDP